MDKNLNPSPKLPWWVILLQISPLILQLVGEVISRTQGIPSISDGDNEDKSSVIPDPIE